MAKVKTKTLVDLACRLGVIEDKKQARTTYAAWLRRDPAAAQRPLVAAMPARPQSPSATTGTWSGRSGRIQATDRRGDDLTAYPAAWRVDVGARQRTSAVRTANAGQARATSTAQEPKTPYPATMLTGHRLRASVIEARGGHPAERRVHAVGDTASYLAEVRRREQAALEASQANRPTHSDAHDAIAAAGENAARLEAMRRAEVERMEHEVWSRS